MTEAQQPVATKPKSSSFIKALAIGYFALCAVLLLIWVYNTRLSKPARQSHELWQNQAKWESQHISHYEMTLDLPIPGINGDYCRPLVIEVNNHTVVSAVDQCGQSFPLNNAAFTLPGVFALVDNWIWQKPPYIAVTYDPTLGYPTSIFIDPWTEPCCQWASYSIRVRVFAQ